MASETVRIKSETHAKLKELSERSGEAMPVILEKAVEAFRRQRFLEEVNQSFASLRENPRAWSEEVAERHDWDATLADGLEDG